MTTKIITPQEVTMEMLVAGVESNETATNLPARYQLVNGEIRYSVKFTVGNWIQSAGDEWEWVDTITFDEIRECMEGGSDDDTIWTTTIQETA